MMFLRWLKRAKQSITVFYRIGSVYIIFSRARLLRSLSKNTDFDIGHGPKPSNTAIIDPLDFVFTEQMMMTQSGYTCMGIDRNDQWR